MEKITAILIDDETHVREGLYTIISKYADNIKVLGMANGADQGIQLIRDTKPDLVFLDVQMSDKTGFDMLQEIGDIDFEVIFVTSHDKYAMNAIKYCALDYLLKPINIADLQMAISKFDRSKKEYITTLIENLNNPLGAKKIVIKHSKGIRYVYDAEIIRCEADGNYCNVYFQDGTHLLVSKSLKDFEELLPSILFHRIHQSHLINTSFVKAYLNGRGGQLELNNGDIVDVARSRKSEVLKRLNNGI